MPSPQSISVGPLQTSAFSGGSDVAAEVAQHFAATARSVFLLVVNSKTGAILGGFEMQADIKSWHQTDGSRDTVQPSLGAVVVDRWGWMPGRITIAGDFRWLRPILRGGARVDGWSLHRGLRTLLRDYVGYNDGTNEDVDLGVFHRGTIRFAPRHEMELRVLVTEPSLSFASAEHRRPPEWWACALVGEYFSFVQAAHNAQRTPFQLTLQLTRPLWATHSEADLFPPGTFSVPSGTTDAASRSDALVRLRSAAEDVPPELRRSASGGFLGGLLAGGPDATGWGDAVGSWSAKIAGIETAARRFTTGLEKTIRYPFGVVQEQVRFTQRLLEDVDAVLGLPTVLQDSLRSTLAYLRTLTLRPDAFQASVGRRGASSLTRSVERRVTAGDSLASIAQDEGVDMRDIVRFNGLAWPFIDESVPGTTGRPVGGIARPGDFIRIPRPGPPPGPPGPGGAGLSIVDQSGREVSAEERAFGSDFKVSEQRTGTGVEYRLEPNSGADDVEVIAGARNLAQGLNLRLSTLKETWPGHPEVGIQRPLGKNALPSLLALVTAQVQEQLQADPRVDSVTDLSVEFGNGLLTTRAMAIVSGAAAPAPLVVASNFSPEA